MKKTLFLIPVLFVLAFSSCTNNRSVASKDSVPFPGMTVSRDDYKLSDDVSATVTVKEFTTLFKYIRSAKVVGQDKKTSTEGFVKGYGLDDASKIAAYRLLEDHPEFDYLTNIKVKKEFTSKWMLLFTKYESKITITAKGITLKADK